MFSIFKRPPRASKREKKAEILHCSFCGKSQDEVAKLIAGPTVFICDECTTLCHDIIREGTRKPIKSDGDAPPSLEEIKKSLIGNGLGQAALLGPLKQLLVTHYKCKFDVSGLTRAGALLISGSSTLRRHIPALLGDSLDLPFASLDTTKLLSQGVPSDIATIAVRSLLDAAYFNFESAQHGVLYIDDADQIFRPGASSFEAVEEALLDLMRGTVIEDIGHPRHPLSFDCSAISVICAGCFPGLATGLAGVPDHQPPGDADHSPPGPTDGIADALIDGGLPAEFVRQLSGLAVLAEPD